MERIHLVDLDSQYKKIKTEIDTAVLSVLQSSSFINGPEVGKFQSALEKYLGVKHVIPCANGTDALQIALMALDLQPGDEVITPSFTYIATAEVIALLRLTPVFVDVDPNTFTMRPDDVERIISRKTKAIVPVHLYGQCADMESIMSIARKHNLYVIEDTAQALGSEYSFGDGTRMKAGTIGHIGSTSFFPSKNLGCYGDGGAIFTNDSALAKKIKMISNHGQEKKYYHDIIGVNSRLDTIQAAILLIKLKHLDEYIVERNRAASFYDDRLKEIAGLEIPFRNNKSTHGFHQYTIKVPSQLREPLMDYLTAKGVPCNIYYPLPVHLQKGFKTYPHRKGLLSFTEDIMKKVLSLPIHTELDNEQLNYICNVLHDFFSSNSIEVNQVVTESSSR